MVDKTAVQCKMIISEVGSERLLQRLGHTLWEDFMSSDMLGHKERSDTTLKSMCLENDHNQQSVRYRIFCLKRK